MYPTRSSKDKSTNRKLAGIEQIRGDLFRPNEVHLPAGFEPFGQSENNHCSGIDYRGGKVNLGKQAKPGTVVFDDDSGLTNPSPNNERAEGQTLALVIERNGRSKL